MRSFFLQRQFLAVALLAIAGRAGAQTTATNVTAAFNPAEQVAEPVTIAQNWNGGEWFASAFMDTTPRINVAYKNGGGAWSTPQLLSATNPFWRLYDEKSADPVLVENQSDTGIAPRRMYVVGVSFSGPSSGVDPVYCSRFNRIAVWSSDNGGQSWSDPIPVHWNDWGTGYFDDKPAALVSKYPPTAGLLYVAFNRVLHTTAPCTGSGPTSTIHFYAFNSPGWSSTFLSTPIAGSVITDPVIFENPTTGLLGLAWMNFDNQSIDVTTSSDGGRTWAPRQSYPDANLLPPGSYVCVSSGRSQQCVTASLGLTGRFNPVTGAYGLVWHHRRFQADIGAEVVFATFTPGSGFSNAVPVSPNHGTHITWQGAIDSDSSGNYVITYYDYDAGAQPNLFTYYITGTKRTGSGLFLFDFQLFDNSVASDPSIYGVNAIVGEYRDLFYWNGYFNTVGVYMKAGLGRGDVYHVRFQP